MIQATVEAAPEPRAVFAHYMVCFAVNGENVEAYKREIREAQAAGIDGFALNEGAWTNEPHYLRRTSLLFQAAKELETDFRFIFSLDLATLQAQYIPEIIKGYVNNPNYYRYKGRRLVSTFSGDQRVDWKSLLSQLKAEQYDICFVPFFYPRPRVTELPDYDTVKTLAAKWADTVDGLFFFGAAGTDTQLAACVRNYACVMHENGKLFMAGCSPGYWGTAQRNRRYFEMRGGAGVETQWKAIIESSPDFVEIVTWNDLNESYICPITNPTHPNHAGFLELTKYYIHWYKTGQQPPIKDAMFYSYRLHPKAAVAPQDKPVTVFHGDVKDVIHLTLMLTALAELRVTTGTMTVTNSAPAGITQLEVPFTPGPQHFEVYRDGKCLLKTDGERIQSAPEHYNFFPTSGFVYAK